MIALDPALVERACAGNRDALAGVVRALERPVFNLAMRMLASRADADDAAQEILILVVTQLGSLRDPGAAAGWALRIAVRHLVAWRRRSAIERQRLTFTAFAEDLEDGLADPAFEADAETRALANQVRVGCTLALLTCLSRPLRMAYLLGEVFELSDVEAAAALDVEPATFRQRLRRARRQVEDFLRERCGFVSRCGPCSCERRVPRARELGRVDPQHATQEDAREMARVRAEVSRLEQAQAAAILMRRNPDFPTDVGRLVLEIVDRRGG